MENMRVLTGEIIGTAIDVHRGLGPGLLECCYESALKYELEKRGFSVKCQGKVPIVYKGIDLTLNQERNPLRYDLVVNDSVVIELKSVEELNKLHFKQLRTYMRFLNISVGLLFNFNVCNLMKEGFGRVVVGYKDSDSTGVYRGRE